MIRTLFFFATFLFSCQCFAQDMSNKGKDFWLVFPAHVPSSGQAQMGLFITSDQNTSGTISVNGWSTTFSVTANQVTGPIDIPYSVANIGNVATVVNKGINVKVNPGQPAIVLYAHIYAGFRSEASLILPVQTLGKKYYSTNFWQASTGGSRSQFNIVATEPNTVVEYQLRVNGALSPTVTSVSLPNVGDQVQVQNSGDLSGSLIQSVSGANGSCKRIAVFSGSSALSISSNTCNGGSFDPLFQQCYPTNTWGKEFGIVPFQNNPNGYHLRVMAMEDNTIVNLSGTTITLNAGEYYPGATSNPTPFIGEKVISADKPISVSQYMMSGVCTGSAAFPADNNAQGDPDMIILNPVEQNIKDISIFSSNLQLIRTKYLNVYMRTTGASSFRINGMPPNGNFVPVFPNNGYSYLQEELTNYTGTFFRLTADSGFNAITYGMGGAESYGYSAGTNVKDLYQQIGVTSEYGIEEGTSVCTGSPFKFKMSLPYLADSIRWNLNALPGNPASVLMTYSNPPVPTDADSVRVINGKTVYWYSLPNTYTFGTVGSFQVTVTIYASTADGCGNEQQIDFDLEINNPPIADFNWTHNGCVDQTVQFHDQTTTVKPTYHWYWDFGDPASGANNTSNLQNPTHTFSGPGTYTVRFANITTPGCLSDTIPHQVVINPLPVGNIAGDITVCQNAASPNIVFTGTTGTAPFTFTYNIDNGTPQTIVTTTGNSVNLPVPTNITGTFNYHLVSIRDAAGTAGCFRNNPDTVRVVVSPLPTANISGNVTVCQNAANPLVTFTAAGTVAPYTFSYNINGGSTQTITTTTGNSVTLVAPTTASGTFVYNLLSVADASSATCSQTQTGTATVIVNPLPTATISGTTAVCTNAASPLVTFTGAGSVAPYTFTYSLNGGPDQTVSSGTGNTATVTVPTTTPGTFSYVLKSVSATTTPVCSNLQNGTAVVTVHPLPTAGFTVSTPTCVTRTISFTDNSVANVGAITTRAWNFGDPSSGANNTSTLQNPTHIFATAGTYTVTLTVTNSQGCVSTVESQQVIVGTLPTAAFSLPEVCLLDPFAQFTDQSTAIAPATVTAWNWNFGDPASGANNTSTVQHAQHTYNAVGNYTVTLVAITNAGCTATLPLQLTVNGGNPQSNFIQLNPASSCSSDSAAIQNKSTIASGNITKVEIYWDNSNQPTVFELDDVPFFDKIYKHKYPTSTTTITYNVRFRAYSGQTCVNDRILPVRVLATPDVLMANIPDQCYYLASPLILNFGSETGGVVGTASYSGPGVSFNGTNWIFNPVTAGIGSFNIQYKFTATTGACADSVSTSIRVLDTASARFTLQNPACEKKMVRFTEQSSAPAGVTLANTVWDFGDGTAPETHPVGATVEHYYNSYNTYTVTMYNVSSTGCRSAATSQPVVVNPLPVPNFGFPASLCLPAASVTFTNSSSIVNGTENTFTYLWNFGDPSSGVNNTATTLNPTHTYNTAGPFNVNLQVTTGAGCVHDTTIVLNTIHPQPNAGFTINKQAICIGDNVSFTSTSNGGDGTIASWHWDFDDGNTSTATNPTNTYNTANEYNIKHWIVNNFGCHSDTAKKPFKVYALPTVNAGPDLFVLEGGNTTIGATYTGEDNIYLWSPSTYLSNPSAANPLTSPLVDITYTIMVSNPGGCSNTDQVFVKVLKAPNIPNTFSPNGDGINERWIIEYLDTYPNCRVMVFTRAGQKVFESRGYRTPWNGTMNGKSLPLDTYYYIIEPENGRKPITGYVTIIK